MLVLVIVLNQVKQCLPVNLKNIHATDSLSLVVFSSKVIYYVMYVYENRFVNLYRAVCELQMFLTYMPDLILCKKISLGP